MADVITAPAGVAGELVPTRADVLMPVRPEDAKGAMAAYIELGRAVLEASDWQKVGRGRFIKRSGLQKLATFYSLSTEIRSERTDRDDAGRLLRHHAVVRATHPSGRYAEGDGSCSADEPRFEEEKGRQKIEHDLPATAVTRATNRAISNLVGFGQISAEEARDDDAPAEAELPSWAQPVSDVAGVADQLVAILQAAGVADPSARINAIGSEVFDLCGGIPWAVALIVRRLHENVAAEGPSGAQEATEGVTAVDDPSDDAEAANGRNGS